MTKYAVAHYDMLSGDLSLSIVEDAANEVEACAKALVDINNSYDYTELVTCADMAEFYTHVSDEESITALPV